GDSLPSHRGLIHDSGELFEIADHDHVDTTGRTGDEQALAVGTPVERVHGFRESHQLLRRPAAYGEVPEFGRFSGSIEVGDEFAVRRPAMKYARPHRLQSSYGNCSVDGSDRQVVVFVRSRRVVEGNPIAVRRDHERVTILDLEHRRGSATLDRHLFDARADAGIVIYPFPIGAAGWRELTRAVGQLFRIRAVA